MAVTIPLRLHARARRDEAAFYLSELARGVLAGQLTVVGAAAETVSPAEFVMLNVDVKERRRGTQLTVTLRWPTRC